MIHMKVYLHSGGEESIQITSYHPHRTHYHILLLYNKEIQCFTIDLHTDTRVMFSYVKLDLILNTTIFCMECCKRNICDSEFFPHNLFAMNRIMSYMIRIMNYHVTGQV